MWKFTDWEAIADRTPDELLLSQCLPGVSELSLTDTKVQTPKVQTPKVQTPKRRGRGTFSYNKPELYSDQLLDKAIIDNSEDEDVCHNSKGDADKRYCKSSFSFTSFNSSLPKSYFVFGLS